jgi:chromate transporter
MAHLELFARFVLVSLLAFGGGQAALPLVERIAVHEARWITPAMFGAAVALAYLTPGPVLIVATFVGYQVAGVSGALTATLGAFLAPWALAALAARHVTRLAGHPWLRRFGAGASPAVVGLLGVTVLAVARDAVGTSWAHLGIVALVLGLTAGTRLHPAALLALGGILGYLIG